MWLRPACTSIQQLTWYGCGMYCRLDVGPCSIHLGLAAHSDTHANWRHRQLRWPSSSVRRPSRSDVLPLRRCPRFAFRVKMDSDTRATHCHTLTNIPPHPPRSVCHTLTRTRRTRRRYRGPEPLLRPRPRRRPFRPPRRRTAAVHPAVRPKERFDIRIAS